MEQQQVSFYIAIIAGQAHMCDIQSHVGDDDQVIIMIIMMVIMMMIMMMMMSAEFSYAGDSSQSITV